MLWTNDRLAWLTLASFDGFGSRTLHRVATTFGNDGVAALQVASSELRALGVPAKRTAKFLEYRAKTDITKTVELLKNESIDFILRSDEAYPKLLSEISDPPFALFVAGNLSNPKPLISIVGTRNCTSYGEAVTKLLLPDLVHAGFGIASGLALGIDGLAHEIALQEQGYTIAVLGSGADEANIYPRQHLELSHRIRENGGAIVSEFPPGTLALRHHFPLRNRILAGLSRATIVIEAARHSGSLVTAHLALEQNREVFSVPGPITHDQSKGTNDLLRQGAIPCTSSEDILRTFGMQAEEARCVPQVTDAEASLLHLLTHPRHIDELARELHLPLPALYSLLTTLECKGLVDPCGGKFFTRSRSWKAYDD